MKLERLQEKIKDYYDKKYNAMGGGDRVAFCQDEKGLYIMPQEQHGVGCAHMFFLRGYTTTAPLLPYGTPQKLLWATVKDEGYTLATQKQVGRHGGYHTGKRVAVITNEAGIGVVIREKFLKLLPHNTLYYVKDSKTPLLAMIEEGGQLHPIAIICPMYIKNQDEIEYT